MRTKRIVTALLACSAIAATLWAKPVQLKSPDGRNVVEIETDGEICYSLHRDSKPITVGNRLSINVDGTEWGKAQKCRAVKRRSVSTKHTVHVPRRSREVADEYNELMLSYKGYNIEFRAYNEGIAYRFVSCSKKADKVNGETVNFNLDDNAMTYTQLTNRMQQWFEYNYTERRFASLPSDSLVILPMLASINGYQVVFAEADVYDYPGIYLRRDGSGLRGDFAYFPATERPEDRGNKIYVDKRESFMTQDAGCRSFPWRVVATYDAEKELLSSELIWLLGSKEDADADFSWIRPGKVLWDWWNCWNVYGVDFSAGINTDTYRYLIDYAARHGIEYLLMDEGWSAPFDLLTQADGVDMPAICSYAQERGVGILLWTKWVNLDRQMTEALDMMQKWGVKGIKVDFMDRNDAKMVDFFERTATECAKRRLMVNFHGCYPPDGMRRRFPNIMTREGVYGLENNKWSKRVTPRHDVMLSFIRQYPGPMDYTPGAMLNAHIERFAAIHDEPMSQGTRSHQVALYVVYESPLQTLADSPVHYDQNPDSRDFIKKIPTVWDETIPLAGKLGEYVAVARRSGTKWYIGAINGTDAPLHLDLDISFAVGGAKRITTHADGKNAARQAKDHIVESTTKIEPTLSIDMARNGGFAAIIE